jgi:putative membrane protein
MKTNTQSTLAEDSTYKRLRLIVLIISFILPLAVALLFGVRLNLELPFDVHILPLINAILNGATAVLLIAALVAVKKGNIDGHKKMIYAAMGFSLIFLLVYVFYHVVTESTKYGGEGTVRFIYFFFLITHIILAAIQAPFVLFAFLYGYTGRIAQHKKIVKLSYPIWLYVSITGVICYLMLQPYYL